MKNPVLLFWLLAWMPVNTCTNNTHLTTIFSYLNACDTAEKSKLMAADFHSFFISKERSGKNKAETLQSFQNWDGPMHPDINIITYSSNDSIWKVTFNEQNDFTKPIGFPGWKGTTIFIFNKQGLIEETIYTPDSTNISYKPFLQPAINWLQKNKPGELNEVYQNGKLIQTEMAATKWRALLQQWKLKKADLSNR